MEKIKSYADIYNIINVIVYFFTVLSFNYYVFEKIYLALLYSFIFLLIYILIQNIFEGFKILVYRIRDISYSILLSVILTQIIISLFYIIKLNFKEVMYLFFIETIISSGILICYTYIVNNVFYTKIFKDKFLLIHNVEENKLNIFLKKINKYKSRYNIEKIFTEDTFIKNEQIRNIIIFDVTNEFKEKIIKYSYEKNINLIVIPDIYTIFLSSGEINHIIDNPFYNYNFNDISLINKILKRMLDLVVSIIILIITLPFSLVAMICIKLEDKGPIFYKQKRLTKNEKNFYVLKFRSMRIDAEKNGAQLSTKNDDRITKVGRFIRKTRIDEIPQLINIVKGEMSIVGPRPEREVLMKEYLKETPEFKYRLKVKAGLTGLAQVEGKYNTTPNDKLKLDLIYITNYNFILDLKIIIKTVKILFEKESTEGV